MTDQESKAREIAQKLQEAGHEAYFAGGCVRDELLGLKPRDFDIATSAHPDVVEGLFRRTLSVGKQFGVIIVLMDQEPFDVATFRTDFNYGDGRHPESIEFTSAKEDVARRDFTINGLLKDPVTGQIHDHVGGRADLDAKLIRTIGSPKDRFTEDHLRMLRAVRFAARLGFELESETKATLRDLSAKSSQPSAERLCSELQKMLTEGHPSRAVHLLSETQMLTHVLPQLAPYMDEEVSSRLIASGSTQSTVGQRLHAIFDGLDGQSLRPELAWGHLLADLPADSVVTRAREVTSMLKALRVSNEMVRAIAQLVRVRDRMLFATRVSAARRTLFSAHESVELLCEFGEAQRRFSNSQQDIPSAAIRSVQLPDPLLRGDELIDLGLERGPGLGRVVKQLRYRQLQGICKTPDDARDWVRTLVS